MDADILNLITALIAFATEVFSIVGIISSRNSINSGFSHPILNSIDIRTYKILFVSASWALLVVVWALGTDYFGSAVMDSEIKTFFAILLSLPATIVFGYSLKWFISTDNLRS